MLTRDKDRVEPSFERNAIKYVTNLQTMSITNNSLVFGYLHVYQTDRPVHVQLDPTHG